MSKKRLVIKQSSPWGVLLVVLFAAAFLAGIALLAFSKNVKTYNIVNGGITFSSKEGFIFYQASNSKQLKKELHLYGLSNRSYTNTVKPYLLKSFPKDFRYLPANLRKKLFISAMLPIALTVREQLQQEHKIVMQIEAKIEGGIKLSERDKTFLKAMMKKYKTNNISELVKRADSVPVSLLIAQAGIESGWGKSRFTSLYNNIYGIHRKHRKPWQPIVMSFDNLYDATVMYMMNLNTSAAYRKFREERYLMGKNRNPYKLAEYLTMYSTKRQRYIKLVQHILASNGLARYDSYGIQQILVSNYSSDDNVQ